MTLQFIKENILEKNKKLNAYGFKNPIREKNKMEIIDVPKIDVTKYVGTETTIESAEVINAKHGEVLKLKTKSIDLKGDDKLPTGKQLTASIMLGLQKSEDGNFKIGKDTKLHKFMIKHNIEADSIPDSLKVGDTVNAFVGLEVECQKSKNDYLEIV